MLVIALNSQLSFSGGVTAGDDGMYWKAYDSYRTTELIYQVDTIAKVCLAIYKYHPGAGVTNISCATLSKRPEWKNIIDWVSITK